MVTERKHDTDRLTITVDEDLGQTGQISVTGILGTEDTLNGVVTTPNEPRRLTEAELASMGTNQLWEDTSTILKGLESTTSHESLTKLLTETDAETLIASLISELKSFGCEITYPTLWQTDNPQTRLRSDLIYNEATKKFEIRFHPDIYIGNERYRPSSQALKEKIIELFRQRTIVLYILNSVGVRSFDDTNNDDLKRICGRIVFTVYKNTLLPKINQILNQLDGFPKIK